MLPGLGQSKNRKSPLVWAAAEVSKENGADVAGVATNRCTYYKRIDKLRRRHAMPILVGLVSATVVGIVSVIVVWFSIWGAAITYVAVLYASLIFMTTVSLTIKPQEDVLDIRGLLLNKMDELVFRKHYLFFRFPFAAGNFAHFLNFARIFGIVWTGICVWQGFYVLAVMLVVFYAVAGWAMMRLYPIAHYEAAAKTGEPFAMKQLAHIKYILSKREDLKY
jgi:hypothetical protein